MNDISRTRYVIHGDARNNINAGYFVRSVLYEIFRPWWYINNILYRGIFRVWWYINNMQNISLHYTAEYLIHSGVTSNVASRNISFVALYVEYFARGDIQTILYCRTFRVITSNIVSRNICNVIYEMWNISSAVLLAISYREVFRSW